MAKRTKRQIKARSKFSSKSKATRTANRAGSARAARSRTRTAPRPAATQAKGLDHMDVGLTANDAAASIKWYCDVLGFSIKERWDEGGFVGGKVVHGGVSINIGQDDWKLGRDRKKGQGVRIFLTTAGDIDAYAKSITSRGVTLEHEPKDEWGFRAFSVADPDGYKITFLKPLK